MKILVICLLMISSVVIIGNVVEVFVGKGKYLDLGVFDCCLGFNLLFKCYIFDFKDKICLFFYDYCCGCFES